MSTTPNDEAFEALLHYLKQTRGFDFTSYERPSLMRLTKKRMQLVGAESFSEYLDYLEANPLEINPLFDALLLNITTFFRDLPAWNYLAQEVIPQILETKSEHDRIRVWTAGCASGEEAYTTAIILAEILTEEAFRTRVKIYATDLDEDAIAYGRLATYTARQLADVPEHLREKYFEGTRSAYLFRSDLRRCVIFGCNNLLQDPPIGHLDLLICRNTLMYFNAETQSRILSRFQFALNDKGFLFVGKAEMLLTHASLFAPINLKYRIFAKLSQVARRDRQSVMAEVGNTEVGNPLLRNINLRLRDEAFESLPIAQIMVDINSKLVIANRQARILFNLNNPDLERPLQDLELFNQPAELRSLIQKAYTERRPIQLNHVEFSNVGESHPIWLDIEILPLMDSQGELLGVLVVLQDQTRYNQLQQELLRSTQEVDTVYEKLQSTNEELETAYEELQSTNEELETTNEELETINEELQSSNEELRVRTEELNGVNAFLESILTSLNMGMIVLNNRLSVQLWNGEAVHLWGIPSHEVEGCFFFDLDIGLPLEKLREPVRACQNGVSDYRDIIVEAMNLRGKAIRCRVICTPWIVANQQQGIIILVEDMSQKNA